MGVRFRRSVRLFPGVRLNFSRSGVSTTVGRRGATMTFGPHGTHVNVGLPGTGLSYRARVSPGRVPANTPPPPQHRPREAPAAILGPDEHAIQSAPVGVLTSPGLGELKTLINEAAVRRGDLTRDVCAREAALTRAQGRLDFAQGFISRLALGKTAPQRAREVQAADTRLSETQAELEGCHVEIDFGLDGQAHATYLALTQAFQELATCERIWDVTSTAQITDRVAARTLASHAIRRTRVSFTRSESKVIKCAEPVLRLANVGERDIQIYPAFLMMRDPNRDFAMIEYRELEVRLSESPFLEEEHVPGDAHVIGQTWKKANKDGSRDLRFNENHSIPIVRYAELSLRSEAGVLEAYQFSNVDKAQTFMRAYDAHRRALATLVSREGAVPAAVDEPPEPPDKEAEQAAAIARVKPLTNLWLDWTALAAIIVALVVGGLWIQGRRSSTAPDPPAPTQAATNATARPQRPAPHRRHRLSREAHKTLVHNAQPSDGNGRQDASPP